MECYMQRRGMRTIVYDSFNRENNSLGNADTGQAWQSNGSNTTAWNVISNRAIRADATNNINTVAYIDCGRTNVIVAADVTIHDFSQGSRLVARMSGNVFYNGMSLRMGIDGSVKLVKRISGTDTTLATETYAYTAGTTYACQLECNGNDFKVYVDGVLKISFTDDNALKTNTKVGMFLPLSTSTAFDYFDNFSVKG